MIRQVMTAAASAGPTTWALLVFMLLFAGMLAHLFVLRRRDPRYQQLAELPLDLHDESHGGDDVPAH